VLFRVLRRAATPVLLPVTTSSRLRASPDFTVLSNVSGVHWFTPSAAMSHTPMRNARHSWPVLVQQRAACRVLDCSRARPSWAVPPPARASAAPVRPFGRTARGGAGDSLELLCSSASRARRTTGPAGYSPPRSRLRAADTDAPCGARSTVRAHRQTYPGRSTQTQAFPQACCGPPSWFDHHRGGFSPTWTHRLYFAPATLLSFRPSEFYLTPAVPRHRLPRAPTRRYPHLRSVRRRRWGRGPASRLWPTGVMRLDRRGFSPARRAATLLGFRPLCGLTPGALARPTADLRSAAWPHRRETNVHGR
jgi:hypothetical protein